MTRQFNEERTHLEKIDLRAVTSMDASGFSFMAKFFFKSTILSH